MVFSLPDKLVLIEHMDEDYPTRCALCWYEHSVTLERTTRKGMLSHVAKQHPWWSKARKLLALDPERLARALLLGDDWVEIDSQQDFGDFANLSTAREYAQAILDRLAQKEHP